MNDQEISASVIDRWVKNGWGKPISHEEYLEAVPGVLKIHLTTTKCVPRDWFPKESEQ